MSTHLILALIVSALQVADAFTTARAQRHLGPRFVELNPLMRALIGKLGMIPAMLLKIVAMSGAAIAAAIHYPTNGLLIALGLLIAVYIYIVINNYRLVK